MASHVHSIPANHVNSQRREIQSKSDCYLSRPMSFTKVSSLGVLMLLCAGGASLSAQNPLSLQQATELAGKKRPELAAGRERTQAASDLRRQAGLLPNPKFIFQTENLQNSSKFTFANQADTYAYLAVPIETSGKRGNRVSVANQLVERSRIEEKLHERNIIYAVKTAFWQALAARQVRDLLAEDVEYFQQVLGYHEARLREGKIAEVDVLRVRLEGERLSSAKVNADLDYERARLQLAREIGVPDDGSWVPADEFDLPKDPAEVTPAEARISERPENLLARKDVDVAEARLGLQRAFARPDLDVIAGYKRWSGQNTAMAGVQINIPLFDRNQGAKAAAEADARAAEQMARATALQMNSELISAQKQYEARRGQVIQRYRPLRDRAREISQISRAAYQEGGTDLLRLLDAERLRTESQLAYVLSLRDYHLSDVELERAKGVQP